MKRSLIIVFVILLFALAIEIVITLKRSSNEELYMLPQSYGYVYDEDRCIYLEVYSKNKNTLIQFTDENQYTLLFDEIVYTLENVSSNVYKEGSIYHVKFKAILPDIECDVKNFDFVITNEKYTVSFSAGALCITKMEGYELLSINKYYPVYSYLNNTLQLVGFNIDFYYDHKLLQNLNVNKYAYGVLEYSIKDVQLDNEVEIKNIIPKYEANHIIMSDLTLESNRYFIPISYNEIMLIKYGFIEFVIDDKYYYLDNIPFITNDISYFQYLDNMTEGEIEYARN